MASAVIDSFAELNECVEQRVRGCVDTNVYVTYTCVDDTCC